MKQNKLFGLIRLGIALAFISAILFTGSALAETKTNWIFDFFGLGVSNSGIPGNTLLTFHYSLSYRTDDSLYSIRYIRNDESTFFNMGPNKIETRDIGLLYGKVHQMSYGYLSFSGGIGIIDGTYGTAFGLPLEARAVYTPLPFLGLSLSLLGNLNLARSYTSVVAGLQIII